MGLFDDNFYDEKDKNYVNKGIQLENDEEYVEINLEDDEDEYIDFEEEDGAYYRSGESFTEQAYELDDISAWLEDAGFEVVGIFDDMTTEKTTPETQRAVFLAKKK